MSGATCKDCGQPFTPTGKCGVCLPCRRVRDAAWRAKRKAAGNPYRSGKMPREYHRAYEATRNADPAVRAKRAEQMRAYAKAHGTREHHKARRAVRHEIEMGRLTRQPCEVCGAPKADAHHDDYGKPLEVRWLCRPHHVEHHAKAEGRA